jgi:hypothetical protein
MSMYRTLELPNAKFFRMLALDLTGRLGRQTAGLTPAHFATEHP